MIFWILGPLMVIAALGLLFARKAVHAALCVAFVMVNLGVLYIVQQADFLGIAQVFVYTGAVMMFFLFVLMLVGVDSSDSLIETIRGQKAAAFVLCLGLALVMFFALGSLTLPEPKFLDAVNESPGNVSGVAELIFGKYVWVFELTSALLITAAVGAMVLAHRQRIGEKRTPEGLVAAPGPRERVRRGPARARRVCASQRRRHPGPAPGRHPDPALGVAGPAVA